MNTPLPLIIVGAGLAGYNVAKEYRKLEPNREIVIISQDSAHFYSKPQLSNAFEQNKTAQNLIVTSRDNMATQLKARILPHAHVIKIDSISQEITLSHDGHNETLHYGQLVLALGAQPKPFPLFDDTIPHSRINGLDDYQKFTEQLPSQCVIIGSGLVGCELAHDFSHRISELNVITPDPYPLFGLVPSAIGQSLQTALSEKGIQWHTDTSLSNANLMDDATIELALSSNSILRTQHVVVAIGLAPDIRLAKEAGITVENGIVVDDYLQTNMANIYALGDCAQIQGICRQYVAPILHSARALAQTLHGNSTAVNLPAQPISLKVSHYPVMVLPPAKGISGEWQIESEGASHKALFIDENGELAGYALSGRFLEQRQTLFAAFQARRPVCTN